MSILLFGVSHRSAPVSVLEQLSIDESDQIKIVDQVLQSPLVTEVMLLSTCNRVEVYAVVDAFHGGLSVIGQVLSEYSGMSMGDLTKYAYVRYSEAAVEHLFAVASGLDSAVIGEQQVLGQVRRAYAAAEASRTVGRVLHELAQRALSVGKRVHSETAIDAAGASMVSVVLGMAERRLGGLEGKTAVLIGAGAMGALSAAHLTRAGIGHVQRFPIQIDAIVATRDDEIHEVRDETRSVRRAGGAPKTGGAVLSTHGNQHLDPRRMCVRDHVRGICRRDGIDIGIEAPVDPRHHRKMDDVRHRREIDLLRWQIALHPARIISRGPQARVRLNCCYAEQDNLENPPKRVVPCRSHCG